MRASCADAGNTGAVTLVRASRARRPRPLWCRRRPLAAPSSSNSCCRTPGSSVEIILNSLPSPTSQTLCERAFTYFRCNDAMRVSDESVLVQSKRSMSRLV